MSSLFDTLGVDWDADERTIKRAYAKLIKEYRPDSHPAEFARIRAAYENALENALNRARWQAFETHDEEIQEDVSQESHIEQQASDNLSNAIDYTKQFEADYVEHESQSIPPYQRLPRNSESELNQQDLQDIGEQEPLVPPYRRIHSETQTEIEDGETTDIFDLPEFRYEFSENEFTSKLSEDFEYPDKDSLVNELLAQLASFTLPKEEPDALACFEQQLISFEEMTLDQRMDYEDALGHWLLYSNHPSLLIFLAACKKFAWDEDHLNKVHHYDSEGKVRFANLLKLANFYIEMNENDNALLKTETKTKWELLRLKTRAEFLERKHKLTLWKDDCLHSELPALQNYFDGYVEKKFQIFAIDIFFAISLVLFTWKILSEPSISKDIPLWMQISVLVVLATISLLMTVSLRRLYDAIQARPSTKAYKIFNWLKNPVRALLVIAAIFIANTILFSIFSDLGIIFLIITTMLILIFPLFLLYAALAKFEKLIANLWWFGIDTILLLERTAAEITPNAYLKFFMRIFLYLAVPVLLVKEYLPEISTFSKNLMRSRSFKVIFKTTLVLVLIFAFVIFRDMAEQAGQIEAYKKTQKE